MKYEINVRALIRRMDKQSPETRIFRSKPRFAQDCGLEKIYAPLMAKAVEYCGDSSPKLIPRLEKLKTHIQAIIEEMADNRDKGEHLAGQAATVSDSVTIFAMDGNGVYGIDDIESLILPDEDRPEYSAILAVRASRDYRKDSVTIELFNVTGDIEYGPVRENESK